MEWQFFTELLKGVFLSLNSITTWIGIVSFIFLFFPKLEWKMKDRLTKIRPYAIHILWSCILISVITTSYSMYANKQQRINELQKQIRDTTPINTKQDIRTFFEVINPKILKKIDAGQTVIPVRLGWSSQNRLSKLSTYPDFDKFLSFKKLEKTDIKIEGFIKELDRDVFEADYYLFPKDALIK